MTVLGQPYWNDGQADIYQEDARKVLTGMPTGLVDCIVTSPVSGGMA
ncbi:hypothetical protein ITP53_17385 [Nonomuraea sp. K274]|uniref:Uncharacterized protein n=1 Tax=Nonomuraea cypriaca TaxID=1187855 RepID=A0A931EYM6_9ACTN|nr:hypothetical protein [Nonomuraea cypriaca]MBF8187475.1 hypothetical protein [Nonomuraea cypriaca]